MLNNDMNLLRDKENDIWKELSLVISNFFIKIFDLSASDKRAAPASPNLFSKS